MWSVIFVLGYVGLYYPLLGASFCIIEVCVEGPLFIVVSLAGVKHYGSVRVKKSLPTCNMGLGKTIYLLLSMLLVFPFL